MPPLGHGGTPHNIESLRVSGEEISCFFEFEGQSGARVRDLSSFRGTCLRRPPIRIGTGASTSY